MDTRCTVLLADDDPNDVILLERAIKRLDWFRPCAVVPDGQEVLNYLQGRGPYADRASYPLPDALILDHRMPKLSGLDVLFWMRTEPRFCSLPVILLSTAVPPEEAKAMVMLRAACCEKVLEMREMTASIKDAISKAQALVRSPGFQPPAACPGILQLRRPPTPQRVLGA